MKRFSGSGSATAVLPCSGSVRAVIADNAIAALLAVLQHVSSNTVPPTAAISVLRKDASIIAIGNRGIGGGWRKKP